MFMRLKIRSAWLLLAFSVKLLANAPASLDTYNVIWATPGENASGSMPIGNGETGLNVWVEKNGDLLFYLSRTDSWSESSRLLKLGRIRVSLSPNPFAAGWPFKQELALREGKIRVSAGPANRAIRLELFVDAHRSLIYLTADSATPFNLSAQLENWRTARHVLKGEELRSSWTMHSSPAEVWESADVISSAQDNRLAWYHRNTHSVWAQTLQHQGLGEVMDRFKDPLLRRTFGGMISGKGLSRRDPQTLVSTSPARRQTLTIVTHTAQTATPEEWLRQARHILDAAPPASQSAVETARWWQSFWDRSWIFVDSNAGRPLARNSESGGSGSEADQDPARTVTRAYILQRWVTACGGRGSYPIKFNGSIFTVEPLFTSGDPFNPDYRRWGDCYWWQNSRLPYQPMLARGDFEMLHPLFKLYLDAIPLSKERTRIYYQAEGVYFPETMAFFGAYSNGDYGWNRQGKPPGEVLCPWWQWAWNQGPELVMLMLDYYDHTGDRDFLTGQLLPAATEILRYFETRFRKDSRGRMLLSPTQAVETYWEGVTNDMPTLAGLTAVLDRLLELPAGELAPVTRDAWKALNRALPELPSRTDQGVTFLLPAETFEEKRRNVENPEIYAIYPFRLFGVGKPHLEMARETYRRRIVKEAQGWQQAGMVAALCGLAGEARDILLQNVRNANPKHRFPVMWGPNYDWLPDQDHGSNFMSTLQSMLLQADNDRIRIFPAWPREWNVSFKFHTPGRISVEGEFRDGKVLRLAVDPPSQKRRVDLLPPQ